MTDSKTIRISYNLWMQALPWGVLGVLIWVTIKSAGIYGFASPILFACGVFLVWSIIRVIKQPRGFDINNNGVVLIGWFWRRELKWGEIVSIEYVQSRKGLDRVGFVKKGKGSIFFNGPSDRWDTDCKRVLEILENVALQHNIIINPVKSGSVFVL